MLSNMLDPQAFWSATVLRRLTLTEGVSPRDDISTVVNTQQALDKELSAMHIGMCSIRTRRNALSPISGLPPEVLVRIFKCYAVVQYFEVSNECPLGWIEVTHVCRRWRDTSLQFPSLWSDVYFTHGPRYAEAMLVRSAAAPISVLCDKFAPSPSFSSLIVEHLHHMRHLRIINPGMAVIRPFVYALPSSSAILESLEINLYILGEEEGDNFELPDAIAGTRLPSLRRFSLDGFWIPWSAPILGGLSHLEIRLYKSRRHASDGYLRASHEELFSVLKTLPALKTLVLVNCLPTGRWMDRRDEVLQLPRLEVLQLRGPSAACFGIAKRLRIRCQVQLRCTDDTDVAEILPFLYALTSDGAGLSPWHTLLLTHNTTGFRLHIWRLHNASRTDDEFEEFENEYENEFDLELLDADLAVSSCSPERSYGSLQLLCRVLPLETIRTIYVSINTLDNDVPIRDWVDMLGRCSEATRVWVRGQQAISFCEALSMTTETDPRPLAELDSKVRTQERPFLGKLETLRLSDVDLGVDEYDYSKPAFHRLLIGWLSDRQNVERCPTLKIVSENCVVRKEWVEELREVAVVKWDNDDGSCGYSRIFHIASGPNA